MAQHFRAGVVVVVRHPHARRVLAFERVDNPGSWQLPQGGIESGERPVDAAWRELREETGLGPDDVEAAAAFTDADADADADAGADVGDGAEWIVYEWPSHVRDTARGRRHPDRIGQVQRWFWFAARSEDVTPRPDGREFAAWRWVDPEWLVDHVVEWRRDAYRRGLAGWR